MTHQHTGRHATAHHHDRGLLATLRYLSLLPRLWRSEVNSAVVRELSLRPGETVIDLGAGAGAAAMEAARTGAHVLAVDPMPLMRTLMRMRRVTARGSIDVRHGAAESIPAEDHSVDAVWTVNTLHHWTDRDAAASELARVLKPGGRVLLLDEAFDDPGHPEHQPHQLHRRKLHFDEIDPEEVAQALERAGFARAQGARTMLAGRPVKSIRATR